MDTEHLLERFRDTIERDWKALNEMYSNAKAHEKKMSTGLYVGTWETQCPWCYKSCVNSSVKVECLKQHIKNLYIFIKQINEGNIFEIKIKKSEEK